MRGFANRAMMQPVSSARQSDRAEEDGSTSRARRERGSKKPPVVQEGHHGSHPSRFIQVHRTGRRRSRGSERPCGLRPENRRGDGHARGYRLCRCRAARLPASSRAHYRLRRHPRVRRRCRRCRRVGPVRGPFRRSRRRQGGLRSEHRNRPDDGQHGRLGGHHQDRRGRHPGLRRLPHGEKCLPLEPQAAGSVGPQLLRGRYLVGGHGGRGRRRVEALRFRARVQRLHLLLAREHLQPLGRRPQRRGPGRLRCGSRRGRGVLLQLPDRAAVQGGGARGRRDLRDRGGQRALQGRQRRHPRLRRLLRQPGNARLLLSRPARLQDHEPLPRRHGHDGRHLGRGADDAGEPLEDGSRRRCADPSGAALPEPGHPRRALHE